jgi:hypothetical protein
MTPALAVDNLRVVYDDFIALKDVSLDGCPGRILRPCRRIRLGKIDAAARRRRPCAGDLGHHRRRRQALWARPATRNSTVRCRWCSRTPMARCTRARRSTGCCSSRSTSTALPTPKAHPARARRGWPRLRLPFPLFAPALRRSAPARGDCPRADPRTFDPSARRADIGARCLGAGRSAEPAGSAAGPARPQADLMVMVSHDLGNVITHMCDTAWQHLCNSASRGNRPQSQHQVQCSLASTRCSAPTCSTCSAPSDRGHRHQNGRHRALRLLRTRQKGLRRHPDAGAPLLRRFCRAQGRGAA